MDKSMIHKKYADESCFHVSAASLPYPGLLFWNFSLESWFISKCFIALTYTGCIGNLQRANIWKQSSSLVPYCTSAVFWSYRNSKRLALD